MAMTNRTNVSDLLSTRLGREDRASDSARLGGLDACEFAKRKEVASMQHWVAVTFPFETPQNTAAEDVELVEFAHRPFLRIRTLGAGTTVTVNLPYGSPPPWPPRPQDGGDGVDPWSVLQQDPLYGTITRGVEFRIHNSGDGLVHVATPFSQTILRARGPPLSLEQKKETRW